MSDLGIWPYTIIVLVLTVAWARFAPEPLNAMALLWSMFLAPQLWLSFGGWLGTLAVAALIAGWWWYLRRKERERLAPADRFWRPPLSAATAQLVDGVIL